MNFLEPSSLFDLIQANAIKGFLADDEAEALFDLAKSVAGLGPCLEIGSYCGKSTLFLGSACKQSGNTLYAVDHHNGSEEHQLGEEYHDADLYDNQQQEINSFPVFKQTLTLGQLESTVIPIVTSSEILVRHWATPLGLVFVDGGHSHKMSLNDCMSWAKHIVSGGLLLVHDIFENPEDGGQGPYLALTSVLDAGGFEKIDQVNSLGILRRK